MGEGEASGRESQRESGTNNGRLSIGVVEDNDDLRDSLVEVLGRHGHRVSGVSSAEELTDTRQPQPFELMLLDLNLPGEDGLSLAVRLKAVSPGLRVIMMTTRTTLEDRVRGYESGADLYLPKPVAEEELVAAVQSMARQIRADGALAQDGGGDWLRVDPQRLLLEGPLGSVALTAREESMLRSLANAPSRRLEHWQLMECLDLDLEDSGKHALAVMLTRLRAKMQQVGCRGHCIRSLRSMGYQLSVPFELRPITHTVPRRSI